MELTGKSGKSFLSWDAIAQAGARRMLMTAL
jgi:hypothetical protein